MVNDIRSRLLHHPAAAAAACGFLLRMAAILLMQSYEIDPSRDHFGFGYETGRIARALALGQGFSNPFHGITGPTAWEAPLYPLLLGAVFKVAGIYTEISAFLILAVNSFFSALTAIPAHRIAARVFSPRVALCAAWGWALLPLSIYWATRWVWETSLSTLLLATALGLALELADARGRRAGRLWLAAGLLSGLIALSNPACLTFLPFAWGWAGFQLWKSGQRPLVGAVLCAALFLAVIAPWELRNFLVFRHFVPIRSNAGAELRLGNGPEAEGIWMMQLHPTQNDRELQKYRDNGEIAYAHMRGREALEYMRGHPGRTARLWLTKAFHFWAGLSRVPESPVLQQAKNLLFFTSSLLAWAGLAVMVVRRIHGAFLFAALLLVYPLLFYAVFPHGRYRHPIEPVMLMLILYLALNFRRHARQPAGRLFPLRRFRSRAAEKGLRAHGFLWARRVRCGSILLISSQYPNGRDLCRRA